MSASPTESQWAGPEGYDDYEYVCMLEDLPEVGAAAADVNGTVVCIAHTADGDVHCIDDTCTHANVSLAEGEFDGNTVECWLHGSRFDLITGKPSGPPATIPVRVHLVKVVDGEVYIALSQAPA